MKEYRALLPLIEKFREYKKTENDIAGAKALLDEGDPEMREMAQEELRCGKERLAVLEEELKLLLLPRDPNDDKNVIVEIRAGAGGDEAALFAGVLYRMYTMFADSEGFKTELISSNETGLGGFREISFMVIGGSSTKAESTVCSAFPRPKLREESTPPRRRLRFFPKPRMSKSSSTPPISRSKR